MGEDTYTVIEVTKIIVLNTRMKTTDKKEVENLKIKKTIIMFQVSVF